MSTVEWVVLSPMALVAVGLMATEWAPVGVALAVAVVIFLVAAWVDRKSRP